MPTMHFALSFVRHNLNKHLCDPTPNKSNQPISGTAVMFLTRSEYDRGVNTFSPEGRLFQVEYAIEAIKLGSTAIGIKTPAGVVMAVEKRITSTLMEPTTVEKIVEVDKHIGCTTSGLMADAR